jgi:hypothetical protein
VPSSGERGCPCPCGEANPLRDREGEEEEREEPPLAEAMVKTRTTWMKGVGKKLNAQILAGA